jgi:hypothetical protein
MLPPRWLRWCHVSGRADSPSDQLRLGSVSDRTSCIPVPLRAGLATIVEPLRATQYDLSIAEARVFPTASSIDRFLLSSLTGSTLAWIPSMAFTTPEVIRRRAALLSSPHVGWWILALFAGIIRWGVIDVLLLIIVVRQGYVHDGRGPIRVDVGVDGLRLRWAKGPSRLEPWQGVRFPIIVKDFSGAGYQAQVKIARYTSFALTGEAASGITSAARSLGLHCSTSPAIGSAGTRGTLTMIARVPRVVQFQQDASSNAR